MPSYAPSIHSIVRFDNDPQTVQYIEKHAIMPELVTPIPMYTAPLHAAMDKIKQQLDKLLVLVASTPIHPNGRSHSPSPDDRVHIKQCPERGRSWIQDKYYRQKRSTCWDNDENRNYRHDDRSRTLPSLQYGQNRNHVAFKNRACFKCRGQYRLGHKWHKLSKWSTQNLFQLWSPMPYPI